MRRRRTKELKELVFLIYIQSKERKAASERNYVQLIFNAILYPQGNHNSNNHFLRFRQLVFMTLKHLVDLDLCFDLPFFCSGAESIHW